MNFNFPFHFDGRGRSAQPDEAAHVRQLIELVLFTAPGERVNRPDFGAGVNRLLFAPNSPELATATEFMVQGALQQWLGTVIQVEGVRVQSNDATLTVTVQYMLRRTQERQVVHFTRET